LIYKWPSFEIQYGDARVNVNNEFDVKSFLAVSQAKKEVESSTFTDMIAARMPQHELNKRNLVHWIVSSYLNSGTNSSAISAPSRKVVHQLG